MLEYRLKRIESVARNETEARMGTHSVIPKPRTFQRSTIYYFCSQPRKVLRELRMMLIHEFIGDVQKTRRLNCNEQKKNWRVLQ